LKILNVPQRRSIRGKGGGRSNDGSKRSKNLHGDYQNEPEMLYLESRKSFPLKLFNSNVSVERK
jgi:hypothetical protein